MQRGTQELWEIPPVAKRPRHKVVPKQLSTSLPAWQNSCCVLKKTTKHPPSPNQQNPQTTALPDKLGGCLAIQFPQGF